MGRKGRSSCLPVSGISRNTTIYGFLVGEGANNTFSGTTTFNNLAEPEVFNATPLNADQYSATAPSSAGNLNEKIGLLGLTWIN